jgi:hypothetical protein
MGFALLREADLGLGCIIESVSLSSGAPAPHIEGPPDLFPMKDYFKLLSFRFM